MNRKKPANKIVTDEKWKYVNEDNKQLIEDFCLELNSSNHSDGTIRIYENGLKILMVWIYEYADNVHFIQLKKKDMIRFNNYILNDLHHSPNRSSTIRSIVSSLGNYIERVCDEEFPNYKNLAFILKNNETGKVWDKNIVTKEEVDLALKIFTENGKYQEACMLSLMVNSGMRVSEVIQTRVDDFEDKNLVFNGKAYKTHVMRTKGRGKKGKQISRYVFIEIKPYLDKWLETRKELGLNEETLFVSKATQKSHGVASEELVRRIISKEMSEIIGHPVNPHCLRHYFTTQAIKNGWPQEVVKDIIQWENISMVEVYNDSSSEENLNNFFDKLDKE